MRTSDKTNAKNKTHFRARRIGRMEGMRGECEHEGDNSNEENVSAAMAVNRFDKGGDDGQ